VTALTLECPKGVSMKTFFTTLLLFATFSTFAQGLPVMKASEQPIPPTDTGTKAKPEAVAPSSTAQEQQQSPGVDNTFQIGDYDKNGKYIFFDRLEREQKENADEAAEQNQ